MLDRVCNGLLTGIIFCAFSRDLMYNSTGTTSIYGSFAFGTLGYQEKGSREVDLEH